MKKRKGAWDRPNYQPEVNTDGMESWFEVPDDCLLLRFKTYEARYQFLEWLRDYGMKAYKEHRQK